MSRTSRALLTRLIVWIIPTLVACNALPDGGIPLSPTPFVETAEASPLTVIPLGAGRGVAGTWFEVYFTDPGSPLASQKTGGVDGPLAAAIDQAHLQVDIAMYSFSLDSIRDSLIRAHQRGVQVRVVIESDSSDRADPRALREAGIPMLGDRRAGLMHDKFVVIDGSEVWMGSMNFTDNGAYEDNNNLMRIRSIKVAEDYATEFVEMFVADSFGPDTLPATPNPRVTIDSTPLDIYFSPDDNVDDGLLELLKNARESIYFLAYSFTSDALGEAVRARAASGVSVAGVLDESQVETNIGTEYDSFRQAGLDIRLDGIPGLMHHKVILIDQQIVVTGSYNFTASAEERNDENLIVIYDPAIAAEYYDEFRRVYAAAHP